MTSKSLTAVLALLASGITLACDYPSRVEIPNGTTATKDEMLAAQRDVKQFVADMEAYLDCIVAEEKSARAEMVDLDPETEQQREDLLNKKYNAAVDEMERVAASFNVEVQAYQERNN